MAQIILQEGISMTEQEKRLAGKLYYPPDPELTEARMRAKRLCHRLNALAPDDFQGRDSTIQELFGRAGKDAWVESSFHCDYGTQISVGDYFFANYDCIFLDIAPITIGSRVYIAPRVCIYTVNHPMVPEVRNTDLEYGRPVTIEDNVWIGGNVVILPGVTIGEGAVIAAGSIVTRDIPPRVVAGGNPCRVIRSLTEADREKWEAALREHREA